ncbi:MAG: ABC transporter substrate-binding protein [Pseudomonadota bacterium]
MIGTVPKFAEAFSSVIRLFLFAGCMQLAPVSSYAQSSDNIVVAGPFSGTYAPMGDLLKQAAGLHEGSGEIIFTDTGCDGQIAANAVTELIAQSPTQVIGIPCIDAFDTMAPALIDAGIPIVAVGLQTPDVTVETGGLVKRIAPTLPQIHERLAAYLGVEWRNVPFAIVDDGTLSGRLLAQEVGAALAEASLEPIFRDTYRPLLSNQTALVRRLARAGVEHVILGGDSFDAAVIGADAARLGVSLVIAGGPNLLGTEEDGRLADGTLIATAPSFDALATFAFGVARETTNLELTFDENGEPIENLSTLLVIENGEPKTLIPSLVE